MSAPVPGIMGQSVSASQSLEPRRDPVPLANPSGGGLHRTDLTCPNLSHMQELIETGLIDLGDDPLQR